VTDDEIKAELKKQNLGGDFRDMARAALLVEKLKK